MPSILVVDDDPAIRELHARAVARLGEVVQAKNGGEALKLLGQRRFDAVLLDLRMPLIDGFVVLQMLSTRGGPNRETPVFVLTADATDEAKVRAFRSGAVYFLTKPVPLAQLVSLVQGKIAARRA